MRWTPVLVGIVLAGCAADSPPGSDDRGQGMPPTPGQGPQVPGGAAGSSGPSDPFGNANGNNPMVFGPLAGSAAPDPTAGGVCVPGMFCRNDSPDSNDCGEITLETDVEVTRTPGNLLVIFDQSGSMDENWSGGGSKLQAAQNALVQAITPLQNDLTIGAVFFPTLACIPVFPPPPGGAVQPIDGPQQIPFQPGPQFLTSWTNHFATRPVGDNIGTPMQEAFDRADGAIQNATITGPLVVVAFTDGEPNCFPYDDGSGLTSTATTTTGVATMTEPQRAAGWLSTRMIKTYMVGLPGANGVQILNDVAVSGGTMQYILPDDPAQLQMRLAEVVQETVRMGFDSCSITLTPAAIPPEKLLMIVDEGGVRQQVPHEAGEGTGWTISDDGVSVEITGKLCDDAMGGRFSSITFEYGCPDVPPPPVLPPVK